MPGTLTFSSSILQPITVPPCCGCQYNVQIKGIGTESFTSELKINPGSSETEQELAWISSKRVLLLPSKHAMVNTSHISRKEFLVLMIKLIRKTTLTQTSLWAQGAREMQWTSEENYLPAVSCSSSLNKKTPFLHHYHLKNTLCSFSQCSKTMACHLQWWSEARW